MPIYGVRTKYSRQNACARAHNQSDLPDGFELSFSLLVDGNLGLLLNQEVLATILGNILFLYAPDRRLDLIGYDRNSLTDCCSATIFGKTYLCYSNRQFSEIDVQAPLCGNTIGARDGIRLSILHILSTMKVCPCNVAVSQLCLLNSLPAQEGLRTGDAGPSPTYIC